MKLLKSVEELLYELVSWLVFYPMTMWRSVSAPLTMMRYADVELADRPENQYEDTLSPPLFLLITLLLAQALSSAIPSVFSDAADDLGSGSNLLVARGVIFSVFPLVMAVTLLRRKHERITRDSLRPPFFSQCYVAAPFVLGASLGIDLMLIPDKQGFWYGVFLFFGVLAWYEAIQTRWFIRDLGLGTVIALMLVLRSTALAMVAIIPLAVVVGWELKTWKP